MRKGMLVSLVLIMLTVGSGCITSSNDPGPTQTFQQDVEATTETSVSAILDMSAGGLTVGASQDLLAIIEAKYTQDAWLPQYSYELDATTGMLTVEQKTSVSLNSGNVNEWDIKLGTELPLELDAHLGAGDMELDLSDLDIVYLKADLGAGDMVVNMRGAYSHDAEVRLSVGAGDLHLLVPRDVGATIIVEDGTDVEAYDLMVQGDAYTNTAYGQSSVTITIYVSIGAGDVLLEG